MARTFNNISNGPTSGLVTLDTTLTYPFTLVAWVVPFNATQGGFPLCVYESATTSKQSYLLQMTTNGWGARSEGTNFLYSSGGGGLSTGVAYHLCGVWHQANACKMYINGALTGTGSSGSNPFNANRIYVGRSPTNTYSFHRGPMWEVGAWSRELTIGEIVALSKRVSPRKMPHLLEFYSPLFTNNNPEQNYFGNLMTIASDFTKTNQPAMYR